MRLSRVGSTFFAVTDFSDLRFRVSAPVLEPGDTAYADELRGANLLYTHSPEAVVPVADAGDIAEVVRFARQHDLHVHPYSTGHGSHGAITDGIVVATRNLDTVVVDADSRIATIGAGARWASVVPAAAGYGLLPIAGSSTNVGVVGYLTGGGMGPLARSHGYSSDWVRGFTVVTGSGELVTADSDSNPDLFWALRGGKAAGAVVTEVRLELAPVPELYAGNILFDTADIETVLRAWVAFTETAPADVTTSVAVVRMPPFDEVPPPLRGKTLLSLRFAYPGSAEHGEEILAPLRALATPIVDTVGPMPLANIAAIHGDPTDPAPAYGAGGLLTPIDDDFVTTLLAVAGPGIDLPIVAVELRHIGSATRTDVVGTSAVGGRGVDYTFNLVAIVPAPELLDRIAGAVRNVVEHLDPWISDETNINFAGQAGSLVHAVHAWPDEVTSRLADERSVWDPHGIVAAGH